MLDYFPLILVLFVGVLSLIINRLKREGFRREREQTIPEGYNEIFTASRGDQQWQRNGKDAWVCRIKVFAPPAQSRVLFDVIVTHNGVDITGWVKNAEARVIYDGYQKGRALLINGEKIEGDIRIFGRFLA
jgi:hypothetical protein